MADDGDQAVQQMQINLMIIGDGGVGKTAILRAFKNKPFQDSRLATTGVDTVMMQNQMDDGTKIKVKFWDTAGQERFRQLTTGFYKQSDGILLAYDVTQKKTFDSMEDWLVGILKYKDDSLPKVILGNKVDLEEDRQVDLDDATDFF